MRFPAPCRCAKPAFPMSRKDMRRPATRTSFLVASSSAPGVWLYFSTSAAGVSVQRNSRGYGSYPSAWIFSSFFWRCSNWSRGSNCNGKSFRIQMLASIAARGGHEQGSLPSTLPEALPPQRWIALPRAFDLLPILGLPSVLLDRFGNLRKRDLWKTIWYALARCALGRDLVKDRVRPPSARGGSVQ